MASLTPSGVCDTVSLLPQRAAEHFPDRPAFIDAGSGGLDWAGVEKEVGRLAALLTNAGVREGEGVAIAMPNNVLWPVVFWGALRVGATVVPVNPAYTEREQEHILSDSQAAVVVDAQQHVLTINPVGDGPGRRGRPTDGLAVLCYTSGTTGRPKGARLLHRNLLSNLDGFTELPRLQLQPDDVLLGVLPFFHVFGLNVVLNAAAWAGACVLVMPTFSPAACLRAMETYGVTVAYGAPPLFAALAAVPDAPKLPRLRAAVSGADSLPVPVFKRFRDRFGVEIVEGYGLTEAAPVVASTAASDEIRPGTVGRALPNVTVELRAPIGGVVTEDDVGEIFVSGPNVFDGYHGDPIGTSETLIDGWLATGDLGRFDADGYLQIAGRLKDLIIVSGFNVYPREVENVIAEHPDILDVAVVGVPDERTGERVRAVVVTRPGSTLSADDVIDHCRAHLARYKLPRDVQIVDVLPRLPTGKVVRSALAQ